MENQIIVNQFLTQSDTADIGIIGGADGPTAILITSRLWEWLIPLLWCVVIAAMIGLIVHRKRRQKGHRK